MSKPIIVNKLSDHGSIVRSKFYPTAHEAADKKEKSKYPHNYNVLKKDIRKLGKHELMGKYTKSGKIEVNKKYSKYGKEIAYHEKVEHKKYEQLKHKKK